LFVFLIIFDLMTGREILSRDMKEYTRYGSFLMMLIYRLDNSFVEEKAEQAELLGKRLGYDESIGIPDVMDGDIIEAGVIFVDKPSK
jgi:hypothetical protein